MANLEEIKEILNKYTEPQDMDYYLHGCIMNEQLDSLAMEIVKKLTLTDVSQQRELLKDKYKPVIKDLQQELTDANEEYADGKLSEVKWLRHTAFLKGKISALLNL